MPAPAKATGSPSEDLNPRVDSMLNPKVDSRVDAPLPRTRQAQDMTTTDYRISAALVLPSIPQIRGTRQTPLKA